MGVLVPIIVALIAAVGASAMALVQLYLGLKRRPKELEEQMSELREDIVTYWAQLREAQEALDKMRLERDQARCEASRMRKEQ